MAGNTGHPASSRDPPHRRRGSAGRDSGATRFRAPLQIDIAPASEHSGGSGHEHFFNRAIIGEARKTADLLASVLESSSEYSIISKGLTAAEGGA